jgi:hypothetical protein
MTYFFIQNRIQEARARGSSSSRSSQTTRPVRAPAKYQPAPAPKKSQPKPAPKPVKVVTILTCPIEPEGYEVVGTNMGGQEVCRLKVPTLSSLLLPDLYKVIEENTGEHWWNIRLVASGGEVLPGRNRAVTLEDALATAVKEGKLAEISEMASSPAPNGRAALLRKWLGSMTSKVKGGKARQ